MTAAELYTKFEINQQSTTPMSHPLSLQKGDHLINSCGTDRVSYSSGTNNTGKNDEQTNNYAMYSY